MSKILNVVHIGKCGGSTVRRAIKKSSLLEEKFNKIKITHIKKVKYSIDEDYLIVIRNPIDRALSAFNWRQYLVVETAKQPNRFKGELQVLKKYPTLNSISEQLYADAGAASIDKNVSSEFQRIHHIHQDISFYLSDMLKHAEPNQIYGIIKQHSLAADCGILLGPSIDLSRSKNHGSSVDPEKKVLSELARRNLRRYFHYDFECILRLYNMNLISWQDYELLSR